MSKNEDTLRTYTREMWALQNVSQTYSMAQLQAQYQISGIERKARIEGRNLTYAEQKQIEALNNGLEELQYQQLGNQIQTQALSNQTSTLDNKNTELNWTLDDTTKALNSQEWATISAKDAMDLLYSTGLTLDDWERTNMINTLGLAGSWDTFTTSVNNAKQAIIDYNAIVASASVPQSVSALPTGGNVTNPEIVYHGITYEQQVRQIAINNGMDTTTANTMPLQALEEWCRDNRIQIPTPYQKGGIIPETGFYTLHKGELVIPNEIINNPMPIESSVITNNMQLKSTPINQNFYIDVHIDNVSSEMDVNKMIDMIERKLYLSKQISGGR